MVSLVDSFSKDAFEVSHLYVKEYSAQLFLVLGMPPPPPPKKWVLISNIKYLKGRQDLLFPPSRTASGFSSSLSSR